MFNLGLSANIPKTALYQNLVIFNNIIVIHSPKNQRYAVRMIKNEIASEIDCLLSNTKGRQYVISVYDQVIDDYRVL